MTAFKTPSGASARWSPAPQHLVDQWGPGVALEIWMGHSYATVFFGDDNLKEIAAFLAAREEGLMTMQNDDDAYDRGDPKRSDYLDDLMNADEERRARQRYDDAMASGLSDAEAREDGWPSQPAQP